MFQIDLNSNLKEEPGFTRRCWFLLFDLVIQNPVLESAEICPNMSRFV